MEAYKFYTKVSKEGIISLPYEPALFDTEVELIVLPKKGNKKVLKKRKTASFISKWSGAFTPITDKESDDAKSEYLNHKHQ